MESRRGVDDTKLCPEYCNTCLKQCKFALTPIYGWGSGGRQYPLAMIECNWCLERFILSRKPPYYPATHKFECPEKPAPGWECHCFRVLRKEPVESSSSSAETSTTGEDSEECWDDEVKEFGQL